MKCCIQCFKDTQIKAIIKSANQKGTCDLCHTKNTYVYPVDNNETLQDLFADFLDTYRPKSLPTLSSTSSSDTLADIMATRWNIFTLSSEYIQQFLLALFPEQYCEQSALFTNPVEIPGLTNPAALKKYSILGTAQWDDFAEEIKWHNRFHTNLINTAILESILTVTQKTYQKNQKFYRARIWTQGKHLSKRQMGAPPSSLATAGRANAEGISCLYIADSADTALHEIRAALHDSATVGTFISQKELHIIDLNRFDNISPFSGLDLLLLAINLPHLKKIWNAIAKPLRRQDSLLEYLPTQYMSDFIKSKGYDGIEYKSTMCKDGINLAIFNEHLLSCIHTKKYKIEEINYTYKKS